mgnify:CR=1 FL=1
MKKQTQENEMGVDSKSMRELTYDGLLDILATTSGTRPLYERCKQELQRRSREEQHNRNKKIVWITIIGTITGTIIGALISTATSYYLTPKPISVQKHVHLHKIIKMQKK